MQPDEILVQTAVSAISPGTEMLLYRGQMPSDMALDDTITALDGVITYPLKYGYAAVGQVVENGQGCCDGVARRFVFAFNPHESHFITKPGDMLPLPDGMEPETAVFLPNMETAVSFVMDGRPVIGERVAVFGQGVVGLLTTSLLAQFPPGGIGGGGWVWAAAGMGKQVGEQRPFTTRLNRCPQVLT
ncbi:MAG: hypothetical protein M5U34_17320 [Chloroflexi bacterium]|nr:hypothetical protein [Chloroflexota bacterium]